MVPWAMFKAMMTEVGCASASRFVSTAKHLIQAQKLLGCWWATNQAVCEMTNWHVQITVLHINLCRNYTAFAGHLSDHASTIFYPCLRAKRKYKKKAQHHRPLYTGLCKHPSVSHTLSHIVIQTQQISSCYKCLLIILPRKSKLPHNEAHSVSPLFRFQAPGWNQACSLFSLSHSLSSLYVRTPGIGHHLTFIMFTESL